MISQLQNAIAYSVVLAVVALNVICDVPLASAAAFIIPQKRVSNNHHRYHSTAVVGFQPQSTQSSLSSVSTTTTSLSPTVQLPPTHPAPPQTFAGLVEAGIMERFGNVERVLESWRLLESGYKHYVYVGPSVANTNNNDDSDNDNNKMLYQECHSYVPGLTIRPFWDVDTIKWAHKLQSKYKAIRQEFLDVTSDLERLQAAGNNIWAGALTEDASSYGKGWNTLVLMDRGVWDPVNVNLFPVTAKAVHDSGAPAVEVFFASLKPHSNIQPHSDFTNFVLTSHLALDIPYSGTNQCRLTIADQTREWINGQVMVFDTSLMHDAVNESDLTRYILMLRVWHPDLTETERNALQFIYDCLNAPEIVTLESPEERAEYERQMQAARLFPKITSSSKTNQGFGGNNSANKSSKKKKK